MNSSPRYAQCCSFFCSHMGGTLVEGGADTTSAFIHTLVLALVNAPEAQKLAQEEIDRVVGDERVPLLDDIDGLPYIRALIKEVFASLHGSSMDLELNHLADIQVATNCSTRPSARFNRRHLIQGVAVA